jgi:hypothetical protein
MLQCKAAVRGAKKCNDSKRIFVKKWDEAATVAAVGVVGADNLIKLLQSLQADVIFARTEPTLTAPRFQGEFQALTANVRLGWK